MSDALVWLCVKDYNCFQQKRNGQTKRSGTVTLSREPGNLTCENSFKYSGLANKKAVDISCTEEVKEGQPPKYKIVMQKKVPRSSTKPNKNVCRVELNKCVGTGSKTIRANTVDMAYRSDLTEVALTRWSKLHQFQKVKKGIAKKMPMKMGRGVEKKD